jgi:internalin A
MSKTSPDQMIVAILAKKHGIDEQRCKYDERGNLISLSLSNLELSEISPEIGRLSNLETLLLDNNQLTQLPPEIGQLTKLQLLALEGNQLTQLPPEIGQLTNLRILSLGLFLSLKRGKTERKNIARPLDEDSESLRVFSNQLKQLPTQIGQLINLQELHLSGNLLTELPSEIGNLVNLKILSLDEGNGRLGNPLMHLPTQIGQLINLQELHIASGNLAKLPSEIGNLKSLRILSIHANKLVQLPPEIGKLTKLQKLFAGSNGLMQVPSEFVKLSRLQALYLFRNQLTQLPPEIGQLTKLQLLALEGNQLTQLPPEIGQLRNLKELRVSENQLKQLPLEVGQLSNLEILSLQKNQLTQLPLEIGQLAKLKRLGLSDNPNLLTPPPEIVSQGEAELLSFMQALQQKSIIRYEAKLLLVGEGGTGKSSLLRALLGKAFDASLDSTHGIEVETLLLSHPSFPECSLVLNTWDFGGQDIYHATHQFFLTKRSLYLVVWNTRTGDEQSKLDFWLKTISIHAPEAPVLMVATHIDERAPELNVHQYLRAYPQIAAVLQISCKTGEGIQELKDFIAQQAATLPLMGQPWPTSWVEVEQALLARPEHHINVETYMYLCASKDVRAEMAQGTLGSYLHDLGKILFFRDDPLLSRMVVLKPNWITKAISHVLEDEPTKDAQGILAHIDLPRIWATDEEGKPYDRALYPAFLRLMERFDLSYQIDPQIPGVLPSFSLVPQLLPYQPPPGIPAWSMADPSPGQVQIEMVYRFDFVPAGIMSWYIVRTHQYTQHVHWRNGVVLGYRGHSARVELFPMQRELRLAAFGVQPYTFFVILKETLDLILARFEGLHVRREVPCICQRQTNAANPCQEVYRYEEDLVRRLEHDKQTIQCPASYKDVSVLELLYGLHFGTAPQVMAKVEEVQEILRRLSALQRYDELLLQKVSQLCEWNVRNFTRLWNLEMHKMEAECPNTFFLIPGSHTPFNPKNWISNDYKLYLMCQHPPGPHCVEDEYGYDLRSSREWWVKISPWLKYLITFLKFGVPMAHAVGNVIDAVDFKQIDTQVKLLEEITNDLPEISEDKLLSSIETSQHLSQEQTIGPALRFLHSFLKEVDQQQFWGGLEKVITLDGNILWLCTQHAHPYEVQPLSLDL